MHESYIDITSRIDEEPTWYDGNGTPRYGEFSTARCPDIYTNQIVLYRIACQACGEEFDVENHSKWYAHIEHPQKLHYGDPPIHGCVGDTMNCEDIEVLQVWLRDRALDEFHRVPELEGPME